MSRRLLIAARSVVPHRTAGYQRTTWDLAAALRDHGWDVTLLTTPVPGRPREFGVDGLHVATVPGAWDDMDRNWQRDAPRVARRLGLDSFDAVLGFGPAGQALRPQGPRQVFHCRDTVLPAAATGRLHARPVAPGPWWAWRRLACELDYLRRADEVVVPAARARDALRRWPYSAISRRPPRIVRNGVPTRRFHADPDAGRAWRRRKGIPDKAPLVVTVARLEPGNGLLDALAAFRAFRHRHRLARYVLVGSGPGHAEVRRRVVDLHLAGHVDFLGRLPDLHVVRWLQAADLFLFLPRQCEMRPPLNVLEAVACRVPVVATSTALDPDHPHPLLHPVPPSQPAAAGLAMGRIWERRGELEGSPLPRRWTMEASAAAYDAVLRGRRA